MSLRRIRPGEYENDNWYVVRRAEDDGSDDFGNAAAIEWSWFVYSNATGDLHDAYPTLREARRFMESR